MIVTFYSFKGGVGRSMGMAAVGYLLAQRGLKVLVIDFDLEAPGLERYFFDESGVLASVRGNPGLIDFVLAFKRALTSETEFHRAEFRDWEKYIVDAIPRTPSGGSVDLMTSGCRHPQERYADYALFVRSFDWQDFFHNWRGDRFFDWLRRELTSGPNAYDVVLVDSRTGVTEMGGICAYQLADAAVLLCAPNYQNLDGTRAVLDDFRSDAVTALRQGRPLEILVIPARVEQSDPVKRDQFFADFERIFSSDGLPKILADAGLDYRRLAVPYERELAIIERLVDETTTSSGALAAHSPARASFEIIADAITLLAPGDRWSRLKREAFDRLTAGTQAPAALPLADLSRRGSGYDAFVCAGADDRREADHLTRALTDRGLQIWDTGQLQPGQDWKETFVRALQYSEALVIGIGRSAPGEWFRTAFGAALQRHKPIVPVLLPGCEDPALALERYGLTEYNALDMREGADPEQIERLIEAIGRRPQPDSGTMGIESHPYPGAAPFSEDQAAYFAGRGQESDQLLSAVAANEIVLLSGAAAAGKTSLVCAGVLPRLRSSRADESGGERTWVIVSVDLAVGDGAGELDRADAARADRPLLVVIDSIDSFAQHGSVAARTARFDRIARLLDASGPHHRFLLVWRGVWPPEERSIAVASWIGQRSSACEISLAPLEPGAVREALERPAAHAGHLFEPGLVDRILQDAGTQPGAIAQIQRTMADLWAARRRGWLTNKGYDAGAGTTGRFRQRLQAFLDGQDPASRSAFEAMLRNMVQFDPQLRAVPAPRPWELLASIPRIYQHDAIVLREKLLRERLIDLWSGPDGDPLCGLAQPVIGPIIDSLARADADFMLWRQRFGSYVSGYLQSGRPVSYTVPEDALNEAREWWNTRGDELSADERDVLDSSLRARAAQQEADRQREIERLETSRVAEERDRANAQRLRAEQEAARAEAEERKAALAARASRRTARIAATLAVVAGAGLALAVWQGSIVKRQQREQQLRLAAETFHQAVERLEEGKPAEALAFLSQTLEFNREHTAARSLTLSLLLNGRWPRRLFETGGRVHSLTWTPDASSLLISSQRSASRICEVATGECADIAPRDADENVRIAAWSPDGGRVGTIFNDGTVRLWDPQTAVATPLPHDGEVLALAWSPDGRQVATGADDGRVRVWHVATGALVGAPLDTGGPVFPDDAFTIAWDPAGDRLVTGSSRKSTAKWLVHIWSGATAVLPAATREFEHDPTAGIESLALLADGMGVALIGGNGATAVWDLSSRPLQWTEPAESLVVCVAWLPAGRASALGFESGRIAIWEPGEQPQTVREQDGNEVRALAWSPSGQLLATASGNSVEVLESRTGQRLGDALAHRKPVTDLAWSSNDRFLATTDDETARIWDAGLVRPVGMLLRHDQAVVAAAWSPSALRAATASADGWVRLWDTRTGERIRELKHGDSADGVAWSDDESEVITTSQDGAMRIWNAGTGELSASVEPTPQTATLATSAVVSPKGDSIATISGGRVRIWRPAAGGEPVELRHPTAVLVASWSPDGQRLATGSDDGGTRIWDITAVDVPAPELLHGPVFFLSWNRDGTVLAAGSQEHAWVWNTETATVKSFPPHRGGVRALALSPDGAWLVIVSSEGTAQIWNVPAARPVRNPLPHRGTVSAVAWSPDGRRLATSSSDGARVWDPVTGYALSPPLLYSALVDDVKWSPDNRRLLTVSSLAWSARVWDVPSGESGDSENLAEIARLVGGLQVESSATEQPDFMVPILIESSHRSIDELREAPAGGRKHPLDQFLTWFLDDPYTRTITPLSSVGITDYVHRLLEMEAVEEVHAYFPAFDDR